MYNFDGFARNSRYVKLDGALYAIQVVVQTAALLYEERGGDSLQVHFPPKFLLKGVTYVFDVLLRLTYGEMGVIVFWYDECHFIVLPV